MNKYADVKIHANSKNGITLIALVITIIVLLILAGISINILLGDNSVVTKAQTANSTTKAKFQLQKITSTTIKIFYPKSSNQTLTTKTSMKSTAKIIKSTAKITKSTAKITKSTTIF